MLNLFNVEPKSLRLQLKDINEETINDDIIDSILRAKNTMTSILYGNDETFKCSETRIYNSINQHDETKIKGSSNTLVLNDSISSWYCLNTLGRI